LDRNGSHRPAAGFSKLAAAVENRNPGPEVTMARRTPTMLAI
jgi:hypothetical protein